MIRFKGTNDSIGIGKEGTDSSWHDVAVDMYKLSSLDWLGAPRCAQQSGETKGRAQALRNSQLKRRINDLKFQSLS